MYSLREAGKRQFAHEISDALKRFTDEHDGELPTELSQLNSYMLRPMSDTVLNSYKMLHIGKLADLPKDEWLVGEIASPSDKNNRTLLIKIDDYRLMMRQR